MLSPPCWLTYLFIYFWNKFCGFIFSSQKILWPHSVTDCNSKQKDLPPIIGKSANMFSNFFLEFLVKNFFGEKKVAIGPVLYMYAYNTSQLKKRQPGGVRGGWQRPSQFSVNSILPQNLWLEIFTNQSQQQIVFYADFEFMDNNLFIY